MAQTLSLSLAQLNPRVGDIAGNVALIDRACRQAASSDLLITSELVLCGYPAEDLLLRPSFIEEIEAGVTRLVARTAKGGPAILLGVPWRDEGCLYNAALLLEGGRIVARSDKHVLANYGVFDEKRIFDAGSLPRPVSFKGLRLGILLCADLWVPHVAAHLSTAGTDVLVALNGSPFDTLKRDERHRCAVARIGETGCPLIYVNQVGGQDDLVFDGASFVLSSQAKPRVSLPPWCQSVQSTRWRRGGEGWDCADGPRAEDEDILASVYAALTLGLRDYVEKSGFPGVLIGLSGGIDSALTAAIAVDALGADRVSTVMMPSPYTAQMSIDDANKIARRLGVGLETVDIHPAMATLFSMVAPVMGASTDERDATEENIQSRVRGLILMALSNRRGHMVVATGNKSEMSVGYATLYGDMCGGFAVLKDVYKTTVFALARWRNGHKPPAGLGPDGPVIPQRVIDRPPSAELKPDQTDEDVLPPYAELDVMLDLLVDQDQPLDAVIAAGHAEGVVRSLWSMILGAEYKRRQAPPGVKIGRRAYGRERRYPIVNGFSEA